MTLSAAGLHILICSGSASMGRQGLVNDSGSMPTIIPGSIAFPPLPAPLPTGCHRSSPGSGGGDPGRVHRRGQSKGAIWSSPPNEARPIGVQSGIPFISGPLTNIPRGVTDPDLSGLTCPGAQAVPVAPQCRDLVLKHVDPR